MKRIIIEADQAETIELLQLLLERKIRYHSMSVIDMPTQQPHKNGKLFPTKKTVNRGNTLDPERGAVIAAARKTTVPFSGHTIAGLVGGDFDPERLRRAILSLYQSNTLRRVGTDGQGYYTYELAL